MPSLRHRALAAKVSALRTYRTKGLYPILWVSDSIFNMDELEAGTESAISTLYDAESARATYGGQNAGAGLLEVADTTYAYVNGAWVTCTRGLPFSHFRALVFEFGRNDGNDGENSDEYRKTYDKILAQGALYFPQVVTSNCPPRALANLSDWDLSNDLFDTRGHKTQCAAVATKWSQRHYDLYADFLALKTAGTYTVAQLMRDAYHPTYDVGATRIAAQLSTKLLDTTRPTAASAEITGSVVNYLFGQPTSGTWALTSTTNAVGPTAGPLPRVAGLADQGLLTTSSGAKLSFPSVVTTGSNAQVWCHFYGQTSGGGFAAYVDRGTASEQWGSYTTSIISNNYPKSFLIASGLTAGTHTIEIEKAGNTSPLCILGFTIAGVA